jgi:uncharacterized protein
MEAVPIDLEPFDLGGQRYLPVPATVAAELTVQRATSGDAFRLSFHTRLHGPCMRCLEDASLGVGIDAREYHDEQPDGDEQLSCEYVVDQQLALSDWARDAIALDLPEQILCRRDCAGLCPVCGVDRNADPHTHDELPVDSRWAALEALRDEG